MRKVSMIVTAAWLAVGPGPADGPALAASAPNASSIRFVDITSPAGIRSPRSWKYGGPLVADLDGDGVLDVVLANHDEFPPQLYWGRADGTFELGKLPELYRDVHGLAPGDMDGDGDLDLLVAVGGGNGKSPRPPVLLRNDGRRFVDVTAQAGLEGVGARGRSVRWIDLDGDGDLDILAICAIQILGEPGPRNFAYENLGEGRFRYHPTNPAFEKADAERILLTDFDGDGQRDFLTFTPLRAWRNRGQFKFADVTNEVLPKDLRAAKFVTAAAELDYDNDGDFDIYLSRGKVYYEVANNAVSFSAQTGRLDLRDEGNKSRDGVSFTADGPVILRDFWHWQRGNKITLPVYLGSERKMIETPSGPVTVAPDEAAGAPKSLDRDGWFLSYLGGGRWRLDWNLSSDLAWDIRASIVGVKAIQPDWTPQELGVRDLLLQNNKGRFTDTSSQLPMEAGENNWGVTSGDFDNDGLTDVFVYRFGDLRARKPDFLFRNLGEAGFQAVDARSATSEIGAAHGDMGAAFDVDQDGRIDLLNGDDDTGHWRLYRNITTPSNSRHWSLIRVGRSPTGLDPDGAVVVLTIGKSRTIRRVGSNGEVHTQSIINPLHFGLGRRPMIDSVRVIWRDRSETTRKHVPADRLITIDGQ